MAGRRQSYGGITAAADTASALLASRETFNQKYALALAEAQAKAHLESQQEQAKGEREKALEQLKATSAEKIAGMHGASLEKASGIRSGLIDMQGNPMPQDAGLTGLGGASQGGSPSPGLTTASNGGNAPSHEVARGLMSHPGSSWTYTHTTPGGGKLTVKSPPKPSADHTATQLNTMLSAEDKLTKMQGAKTGGIMGFGAKPTYSPDVIASYKNRLSQMRVHQRVQELLDRGMPKDQIAHFLTQKGLNPADYGL